MPADLSGYRQRKDLGGSRAPVVQPAYIDPGFGQVMQSAASGMSAAIETINRDKAETESLEAAAKTQLEFETQYQHAQATAKPGAPGFTPAQLEEFDKITERFGKGLQSEQSRKRYHERMLRYQMSIQPRALGWEATQSYKNRIDQIGRAIDDSANALYSAKPDARAAIFQNSLDNVRESLEAVELPPDVKLTLRNQLRDKLGHAAVTGDIRDRPESVHDFLTDSNSAAYYSKLRGEVDSEQYYRRLKYTESRGKNVAAKCKPGIKCTAFGPYQFTIGHWDQVRKNHPELKLTKEDRMNPLKQEVAIRADTEDNARLLKQHGFKPDDTNLYMVHFLGAGGGPRFLNALKRNPNDDVRLHVDPAAIAANPGVFKPGTTVAQVYVRFLHRFGDKQNSSVKAADVPSYYKDLSYDGRRSLYGQASTELNRVRTGNRAAFKQDVDNILAEFAANGSATKSLTRNDFVQAFGVNAGELAYGEFAANSLAAKAQYDLKHMSIEDHGAYIEGMRPKAGDDFFSEKTKGMNLAAITASKIRGAVKTDSAGYAISNNPNLAKELQDIADPNITPDEARARANAFLFNLEGEYIRLGVPVGQRRTVPKAYRDRIIASMNQKMTSDAGAGELVSMVNNFSQMWGEYWPEVYNDMKENMSAPLQVITSGIKPEAAKILAQVRDKSANDLASGTDKSQLTFLYGYLDDHFDEWRKTVVFQPSTVPTVNTFYEQAKKLAVIYTQQGMNGDDAAAKAFDDLIGFKYRFVDSSEANLRIPKVIDSPSMEWVLSRRKADILDDPDKLHLAAQIPGMRVTEKHQAERTIAMLSRDAKWSTLPDDSGVGLFVGGQIWSYKNGEPIAFKWDDIADDAQANDIEEDLSPSFFGISWGM